MEDPMPLPPPLKTDARQEVDRLQIDPTEPSVFRGSQINALSRIRYFCVFYQSTLKPRVSMWTKLL